MTSRSRRQSGYVLVVALLSLVAMLLLAVGAIQFTGVGKDNAQFKAKGDTSTACAQSAKRALLSKLKLYSGIAPAQIILNDALPDNTVTGSQTLMQTGHYDGTATATVVPVSASAVSQASKQIRDLANALPASYTLGGQFYNVVVKCKDSGGRESETEFVFRYGL